ncbi:unnamed protein product, partial [Mesorhabditis belari]|uniref:Piezo-type mechanosensitive ion channel component n=1 Tax=Mesorhabditis belari TaxID=2138241 RepID=A0AAF3EYG3_9BILA
MECERKESLAASPKENIVKKWLLEMVSPLLKTITYRGLLPAALIAAAFIRPSFISVIYLVLALIGPVLPSTSRGAPLNVTVKFYVYIVFLVTILTTIAQCAFQIYESTRTIKTTSDCSDDLYRWLRQAGFLRYVADTGFDSWRSFLPEVFSLICSFCTLIIVQCLNHQVFIEHPAGVHTVRTNSNNTQNATQRSNVEVLSRALLIALKRLSNAALFIFVALAGCIQPSILNSFYFLIFLFMATWWSTYKPLRHSIYNKMKITLLFYSGLHLILIYLYQIPEISKLLPPDQTAARMIGFSQVLKTDCSMFYHIEINNALAWNVAINPLIITGFYFLIVLQLNWTSSGTRNYLDDEDASSSVHEEGVDENTNSEVEHPLVGDRETQSTIVPSGSSNSSTNIQSQSSPPTRQQRLLDTEERSPANRESVPMRKITSQVIDKQKISQIFNAPGNEQSGTTAQTIVALIAFCVEHSYVFGLMTMMIWALLYHSAFGLGLLAWACIIWMFRDTRSVSFKCSPFIVSYVEFLLVIQYVWSMDLEFLPAKAQTETKANVLEIIGFINYSGSDSFLVTFVKVLLSLPIFLLHRLKRRDSHYSRLTEHERQRKLNYGTFGTNRTQGVNNAVKTPSRSQAVVDWLSSIFTTYWILIVALVLLLQALGERASFINIGFFIFWSLGVLQFKLSFRFFRGTVYASWTFLIIYTSAVIIAIYTYQFRSFPEFLEKAGLSKDWAHNIGLYHYADDKSNTKSLFTRLLLPISLFVVTMLQLKFFHEPWSQAVQPIRATSDSEPGTSNQAVSLSARLKAWAHYGSELLWRIMEVHIAKIVFITVMAIACKNITAMYIPVVVLISLGLCLPRGATGLLGLILTAYLAVLALAKMVFQMSFIKADIFGDGNGTCEGDEGENATSYNMSTTEWAGFKKNQNMFNELGGLLVSICALTLQSIVIYRQRNFRIRTSQPPNLRHRIFPELDPVTYDHSLVNCFKFFVDFGFYKFGLECCLVMIAINAWIRMDMLGAVVIGWLAVFALSKRTMARWLWPIFLIYLVLLLPIQFSIYVGLPPSLCIDYPWKNLFITNPTKRRNLLIWLGLADYDIQWTSANLLADFFLLMFVSCQAAVFRVEGPTHPAGDNDSIYKDGVYQFKNNPRYDFVTTQRSFVDYFKKFVFLYAQWMTLVTVMVAGLGGTSLFALGYLCLAFWILWSGNALYVMKNHNRTIKKFMIVLGYTVFSMFCKVSLQVVGCVFLGSLHGIPGKWGCILRQIFSIACVNNLAMEDIANLFPESTEFDKDCPVSAAETRIGFDTLALAFLVLQLRIFHSWYFQHAMTDFRAEIVLANRGAVLANQLIEKEMKEQTQQQNEKFNDIKRRTDDIRAQYQKQQALERTFEPKTYGQAKRAGDYYMFEKDPENLVPPIESFVPEVDPEGSEFRRLDPTQLVYTAVNKDMNLSASMRQVEKAELIKDDEERRMIAAVTPDTPPTERVVDEPIAEESDSFFIATLKFVFKFAYNVFDWTAVFLNRRSREHRYVAYVLGREKQRLKNEYGEILCDSTKPMADLQALVPLQQLQVVRTETDIEKLESEALGDWQKRSVFARLFNALGDCVNAHTDVICYVLAIMAHAYCAGLITLPLPLLVFFWGSLSNPRPSKMFWIVLIAITESIIIIKFIFQFGFFEFNTEQSQSLNNKNQYQWNKLFGVQRQSYYAFLDVTLLIFLFYHRYNLRRLGLWKDANINDTFSGNNTASIDPLELQMTMENTESPEQPQEEAAEEDAEKKKEMNPFARFFNQLFRPKFRYIRDLYPFFFAFDIICIFIITFGYSSFGEGGSGNVVSDIQSNRIPLAFVIMLIVLTCMIVIDRGLYLRKAVYCKLAYQLISIIFLHIWIFLVLPSITKREASSNRMALLLYFVKCMYFLVSAWQIRNGYPALCVGNLLTHAYGLTNMVFFKIFMAVPFLFELRTAIDWTWTDTSMPLFDFFNMENFYATIYNLKCGRQFEQSYPAPRGVEKGSLIKYLMGIPMILFIILIIWSPLIAFSLLNRIGVVLTPNIARMSISVDGYPPLYSIEAQGTELKHLTAAELSGLRSGFSVAFVPGPMQDDSIRKSRSAVSFLDEYTQDDSLKVLFRPESEQSWDISDDSKTAMIAALNDTTTTMQMQIHISFTRPRQDSSKEPVTHTSEFSIAMDNTTKIREQMLKALRDDTNSTVIVSNAIPVYLIVPNEGEVIQASALNWVMNQFVKPELKQNSLATLKLTLNAQNLWTVEMQRPELNATNLLLPAEKVKYGTGGKEYLQLVSFVDRTFPSFFAKYVQGGVIAMYIALVIVVGKVLRGLFTNQPLDVIIAEIPNPDHLLKICLDIYLVREAKDFVLEQDLFAKLIFLFRSPETLIKWTRYKFKDD